MRLYAYASYQEYASRQIASTRRKMDKCWAKEENIHFLARYLTEILGKLQFGLCHGTRGGHEQRWFREALPGCEVIGTDISPEAATMPYTVLHDFNCARTEWLGSADFIYSNAFDHAFDPGSCLRTWMACLNTHGLCLIEHSKNHGPNHVCARDPFGADLAEMYALVRDWGFRVMETLALPVPSGEGGIPSNALVVTHP